MQPRHLYRVLTIQADTASLRGLIHALGSKSNGSASEIMKTASERLFEEFATRYSLNWRRVPEGASKTPDYHLTVGEIGVAVEIEQIESAWGFNPGGVSSRTVGSHIRRKIADARPQIREAAKAGMPAILLVHNMVDPLQLFGTEQHDFLSAMYGELTVRVHRQSLQRTSASRGRNSTLREGFNTSFSGVGHLRRTTTGGEIVIYENVYAANPLPFSLLPASLEVVRVEIEHAA